MNLINFVQKKRNLFFIILFVLGSIFLFWKIQYGYIFNDEPFILSLGHRMLKGDKLFINEWNATQLFSFLNFPIIKLFSLIKKPVIELVLFVRIIYVIWWLFVSYIIYRRLKQFGLISLVAMLYFMLFTPLDTMSITYNAMSLSLFCLFTTYFLVEGNILTDLLTGIVLALAVLASPYSVFLYFVYAMFVIIVNITALKNKPFATSKLCNFKVFINITLGAFIVAMAFLGYLYWVDFDNVFNSFKMIFIHRNLPFAYKFITIIKSLTIHFPFQAVFGTLVIAISFFDKKRYERKIPYFIIQAVLWALTMACTVIMHFRSLNLIMFPLTVLGLQSFILTKNKNFSVLFSLWISGIIFAICSNESSDTGVLVFSMAATISGIGSLLLISSFARELDTQPIKIKKLVSFVLVAVFSLQLGCQFVTKVTRSYLDELLPMLDTRISVGVAKGIITTKENALKYEEVYEDLQTIKTNASPDENVLIASLFPSAYLDLDMNYGTYSSWTYINNGKNFVEFTERLKTYYDLNPKKKPQYVYVLNEDMDYLPLIDDVVNLENYDIIQGERGMIFHLKV